MRESCHSEETELPGKLVAGRANYPADFRRAFRLYRGRGSAVCDAQLWLCYGAREWARDRAISCGGDGSFLAMPGAGSTFVLRRVVATIKSSGRCCVHCGGVVPDDDVWGGCAGARFVKGLGMPNVPDTGSLFEMDALLGIAAWLGIAAGSWIGRLQLDVIELLFLLAPWIVVPLATSLIPHIDGSEPLAIGKRAAKWIVFAAAVLATISFFLGLAFLVGPKLKLAAVVLIVVGQF